MCLSNLFCYFAFLKLMDQGWLEKLGVAIPLVQEPAALKGVFNFLPPTSVSLIGSYACGVSLGPHLNVDIAIEMPEVRLIEKWQHYTP